MYVYSINVDRNCIALGNLLKSSPNGRMYQAVENVIPQELLKHLGYRVNTPERRTQDSRIVNGEAMAKFRQCAKYLIELDAASFMNICSEIGNPLDIPDAHDEDTDSTIAFNAAVKIIVESEVLNANLKRWLNDALSNGGKYLHQIRAVLAILAITRGSWDEIATKLLDSEFISPILDFPHYTDYERHLQEQFDNAKENVKAYHKWRKKKFNETKGHLLKARENEQDAFCRWRLTSWLNEVEERILAQFIKDSNISDVETQMKELANHPRYGYLCYRVSEFYHKLSKKYEDSEEPPSDQFDDEFLKEFLVLDKATLNGIDDRISSLSEIRNRYQYACYRVAMFYQQRGNQEQYRRYERAGSQNNQFDDEKLTEFLDAGNEEDLEGYMNNLQETYRRRHKRACYLVAEYFKGRRKYYLDCGVKREEPYSMCQRMKDLNRNGNWKEIADKLTHMPTLSRLRGEAYWQLYLDSEDETLLLNAYRCGFPPEAVRKYISNKPLSFGDTLSRADFKKSGRCIMNIDAEHPVAQILNDTLPESWIDAKNPEIFMYLFAKDDAVQNLEDFLAELSKLRDAKSLRAMFFIRGESELLMPIVDTELHRWYSDKKDRPTIRVQILDDAKRAAEELLARAPLFYPLWERQKAGNPAGKLHLILIGEGKTIPWLLRDASWLMTFTTSAKISLMSPHAEKLLEDLKTRFVRIFDNDNISVTPFNVSESQLVNLAAINQAVIDNDAIYFVVDTGDSDLKNMAAARRIREIHIRTWNENGTTAEPTPVPIAMKCENPVISFMSSNSIVFSEESGEAWFNSQKFIQYGVRTRYTWRNLVSDSLEKTGIAVHMTYSQINTAEDYRQAFKNYARFTYNQDSSVAAAVSLPYRAYLLSRFDSEIIPADWDILDANTFFAQENRPRIADFPSHDAMSKIGDFYKLLGILRNIINKMLEHFEACNENGIYREFRSYVWDSQDFVRKTIDDLFDAMEKLVNSNGHLNYTTFSDALNKLQEILQGASNKPVNNNGFNELSTYLTRKLETQARWNYTLRNIVEDIFKWEHARWNAFMISRGWQSVTADEARKYIAAGNHRQQCHIARLHPCITSYGNLDDLSRTLNNTFREIFDKEKKFNFKNNDIKSICRTNELIIDDSIAVKDEIVKDLFGIDSEDVVP